MPPRVPGSPSRRGADPLRVRLGLLLLVGAVAVFFVQVWLTHAAAASGLRGGLHDAKFSRVTRVRRGAHHGNAGHHDEHSDHGAPYIPVTAADGSVVMPTDPNDGLPLYGAARKYAEKAKAVRRASVAPATDPPTYPPQVPRRVDPHSIFVAIAAINERRCRSTLLSLYATAKRPTSLYVGLADQYDTADAGVPCLPPELARAETSTGATCAEEWCAGDNIKVKVVDPIRHEGRAVMRYRAASLYAGERYVLIAASTFQYEPAWDVLLTDMHMNLANTRVVISHRPNHVGIESVPHLCGVEAFGRSGLLRPTSNASHVGNDYPGSTGAPVTRPPKENCGAGRWCPPQAMASLELLFGPGRLMEDVPVDSYLAGAEDAEDMLYSARVWTHGYDIVSPAAVVAREMAPLPKPTFLTRPPNFQRQHHRVQNHPVVEAAPTPTSSDDVPPSPGLRRAFLMLHAVHAENRTRIVSDAEEDPEVVSEANTYGLGTTRGLTDWYQAVGYDPVSGELAASRHCITSVGGEKRP